MHVLDRPVWESLVGYHASLSEGGALAKRFLRDVNLFASSRDDSQPALAALATMLRPGEKIFVLQVPEIVIPPGLRVTKAAQCVQMLAASRMEPNIGEGDILPLTDADAAEMFALATLTEPGPFLARTNIMGKFIGIRIGGRLAAMAGERFRMEGYTEVSGVCTHPDFRGRGLARRLSIAVATAIEARGEQPFLHAWKTNLPAISLYERLGFRLRAHVNVAVLEQSNDIN